MSAKIYTRSDINIPITLSGDITVSDVVDISVTFTKTDDASVTIEFKKSSNQIDIIAGQITLRIAKTDILTPGVYKINIKVTDTAGKERGLEPTPGNITFY
jgi:hypothetical protein